MEPGVSLDLSVLEELDFPASCGHSRHSDGAPWHGGDAEFVAVSFHACAGRPDVPPPHIYPCCRAWAEYVLYCTAADKSIMCARCGVTALWAELVTIVSTLT